MNLIRSELLKVTYARTYRYLHSSEVENQRKSADALRTVREELEAIMRQLSDCACVICSQCDSSAPVVGVLETYEP